MSMILISHRGNITGPNDLYENSPQYITTALEEGFDVEIDVRYCKNTWYLGHDWAQYEITFEFLQQQGLWLHCKDYITLLEMSKHEELNFFYHTNEDYVLTSQQYIWAYPGKNGFGGKTICVLPELNNSGTRGFIGICSDYIKDYAND